METVMRAQARHPRLFQERPDRSLLDAPREASLFPAEPGRAIQRAQTVRQVADYEASSVPRDDAVKTVRAAESFVAMACSCVLPPIDACQRERHMTVRA